MGLELDGMEWNGMEWKGRTPPRLRGVASAAAVTVQIDDARQRVGAANLGLVVAALDAIPSAPGSRQPTINSFIYKFPSIHAITQLALNSLSTL